MSERVRVLLISSSYGAFGGIQAFVFALANALREGDDFDPVVRFKRFEPFNLEPGLALALREAEVDAEFVDPRSLALAREVRAASVVHAQTPSIDIALAARTLRTPLAITLHEFRSAASRPRLAAAELAIRLAARRWYTSDYVGETWGLTNDPRGGRMPVLSELPSAQVPTRTRRGFVFIGRWIDGKGLGDLVEAYARARLDRAAWPLTLVGDGPLRGAVAERVTALDLDAHVRQPGFLYGAERERAIASARWMVVPSHRREPLGLAAIEARSVGVPCIVSDDGGLLEAAGRHALVHRSGDVDALAALMQRAAEMPEADYDALSQRTEVELRQDLRPLSVYAESYRELLADASVSDAAQGLSNDRA